MGISVIYLLKERKFLPFFLTQFFGAFNDNAFKLAMLTMISYHLTQDQTISQYYQVVAGALFIAPFFLFSASAGQLADKYDKTLLIRIIKLFELFLMIIGSVALYYGNIPLMMYTLAGMGIHSSFFGPIKYAILPDHLPKADLLGATGLIDASTFIAILLGTILGTLAIGLKGTLPYLAVLMILLVAVFGLFSSLFIPRTPSFSPNLKVELQFWRATFCLIKQASNHIGIFMSILILSWFWLLGSVLLTKLPDYIHYVLGANNHVFAVFLALFSIGMALGSLAVNLFFKGRIVFFITPWAMVAFSCFTFDLYLASPINIWHESLMGLDVFFMYMKHWRIALDLFMVAFSSGFFVVPLYTYLQITSVPEERARVIATNNIYNALFIVLGSLMVMGLLHFNVLIPQLFLILSLLNLIVVIISLFYFKRIPIR